MTTGVVLASGVLGGFTTYSAFSYETSKCIQEGRWNVAVVNVVVTVFACLAACMLGWLGAKWIVAA